MARMTKELAIKILSGETLGTNEQTEEAVKMAVEALSAQRRAKWIWMGDTGDSRWMCSVCKGKEKVPTIMGEPTVWEFCPNCGARMYGKETEDE